MKNQSVVSLVIATLFASSVCNLGAFEDNDQRGISKQTSLVSDDENSALRQAVLQGEPINLANVTKLFPGFEKYEFDSQEVFDPANDGEGKMIKSLDESARKQKLNSYLQLSMDETCRDLKCDLDDGKWVESDDVFECIRWSLNFINHDIQSMAYYGGKFDSKTLDNLINYFYNIPYGGCLLSEAKERVVEGIITIVISIPQEVLNPGDLKKLNTCCVQIWKGLLSGSLWEKGKLTRDQNGNIDKAKNNIEEKNEADGEDSQTE